MAILIWYSSRHSNYNYDYCNILNWDFDLIGFMGRSNQE